VTSGATLVQALTAAGLITASAGLTVANGKTLNVGLSGTGSNLNVYGPITTSSGITVTAGATSVQALTTAGLLTASAGLTITTGQTLNVGSSGTTSPLNVYGLATIMNGLTVTASVTSVQALTAAGLITASAGITVAPGTVALPSITFTPDTTTGFYRIGTNNIGITTNGVKRFDVSNTLTQITTDLLTTSGYRRNTSVNAGTAVTLTSSDNFVEFSSSSNTIVTLPTIAGNSGREYTLVKTGTGNITINTFSASEFIDDGTSTSVSLTNLYNRVTLVCGSIQWYSM
jgi:hypothetical protein